MLYSRVITHKLKELASFFRVVTIIGPRQAGKSTLCKLCFPDYAYVSLESPDQREFAETDPRGFLKSYPERVIIDEVQRVPTLLSYLQEAVDADEQKGRFILTGSNQLALSAAITQSLAGRTAVLTLLPLSLEELPPHPDGYERTILDGFMPGRHQDQIPPDAFYRSYFQTYVERDVRQLAQLRDFSSFQAFIRLCAGRTGQILNLANLANDTGASVPTIQQWLSLLEASFILMRLPPYFENFGKRLIKSPKLYFIDTGLAAWLLGIETVAQLERDPLKGALFENLVILEAIKARLNRGKEAGAYYFRTNHGHEVDLVLTQGRALCPVEIKASGTWNPSFAKGLTYFKSLAGDRYTPGLVCYGGAEERVTDEYRLVPFRALAGLGEGE